MEIKESWQASQESEIVLWIRTNEGLQSPREGETVRIRAWYCKGWEWRALGVQDYLCRSVCLQSWGGRQQQGCCGISLSEASTGVIGEGNFVAQVFQAISDLTKYPLKVHFNMMGSMNLWGVRYWVNHINLISEELSTAFNTFLSL